MMRPHAGAEERPTEATANAAHQPSEQRAHLIAEVLRRANGRLAVARMHRHLHTPVLPHAVPGEGAPDGGQRSDVANAASNHVDEEIEVALGHLAVDDDLELDLLPSAGEAQRRTRAVA